jgi:hypothetical protein
MWDKLCLLGSFGFVFPGARSFSPQKNQVG